jgi:hypothetical protein
MCHREDRPVFFEWPAEADFDGFVRSREEILAGAADTPDDLAVSRWRDV